MGNNVGNKIQLLNAAWADGKPVSLYSSSSPMALGAGESGVYAITGVTPTNLRQGDFFEVKSLVISYRDLKTGFLHNASGFFQGKLEYGTAVFISVNGITLNSSTPMFFINFSAPVTITNAVLNSTPRNITLELVDFNNDSRAFLYNPAFYGVTLADGAHEVFAEGIIKNTSIAVFGRGSFTVDTIPPSLLLAPVASANASSNSAIIFVNTAENTRVNLIFGSNALDLSNSIECGGDFTQNHSCQLSNLTSSTVYSLRVFLFDSAGNTNSSSQFYYLPLTNNVTAYYPTASINTSSLIDFANATLSNIELVALGDGAARVFNSNLTATVSRVLDAGAFSNWGVLHYSANETNESRVVLYTRSGNTSIPDAFWSGFHNYSQTDLDIASPYARYLEWTAVFWPSNSSFRQTLYFVNATFNAAG
ncbi:hypothetical protein HY993_04995 [Candidatus Micrarchaeota archaeon]|nr:hypothetical protein [Candidatus Micrarchaeota archaeon]